MLNFTSPITESHTYNNFSMKEKTPVAKINLRGNLENKEFASKAGKILGMILPNESCSSSTKEKITCLTAYSKTTSQILDKYCDIILVGDSLGMALYGMKNTKSTEKGIESLNREFRQYEQVSKDQVYHLSEQSDQEEFDTDFEIKSVDFSLFTDDKIRFVTELGSALEEIGFAIITNHGIDPNLYDKAEQKIIEFFKMTNSVIK